MWRVVTINTLKKFVPVPWRGPLRSAYTRLRFAGWHHLCNICGTGLRRFVPHGIPPESNFLCPFCYSKPPHRLASVYFDMHAELFIEEGLMLHVAPELGLGRRLSAQAQSAGMRYRGGGITGVGDQYIDLLDLPFENDSIALVYCCHVLNSLQDDRAAINEVYRALHPDGVAILQVPAFYQGATTLETQGTAERIAAFGDDGIYRCYTNDDYEARLRAAGFEVKTFRAADVADDLVQRYQLKQEVMHLCRKPGGGIA